MSASRQTLIPIDHVIAEVAAWPLSSTSALRLGLVELDPKLAPAGPTAALWRRGESSMLRNFPGFSIDEAVAVRDRTWFREIDDSEPVPLHLYINRVARRYLFAAGNIAHPWLRYLEADDDRTEPGRLMSGRTAEAEDRRAWKWLSFALPSDLLLAGLQPSNPPYRVHLVSPPVENLLREHGFAEPHLHLGAAIDFPTLWAAATCGIGHYEFRANAFKSPGAALTQGRHLGAWVLRACLTRFILGAYLAWGRKDRDIVNLREFLSTDRAGRLPQILSDGLGVAASDGLLLSLSEALEDIYQGRLGRLDNFRALQRAYQTLTGNAVVEMPKRFVEVQALDPLSRWFPVKGLDEPGVELRFLAQSMLYLDRAEKDPLYERLFWQTVRVRSLLFRHCIQRPLTPGLQYFIRFYERKSCVTGRLAKIEVESAALLSGLGQGLKSLEVRMRPQQQVYAQLRELERVKEAFDRLPGSKGVEFGVVLHFLKKRGDQHDRGTPPAFDMNGAADPSTVGNEQYRYGAIFKKWRAETRAVGGVLRRRPSMLRLLRGFDICRDEASIPTWVYACLFRELTKASFGAAMVRGAVPRGGCAVRLTAHVGEDFVHLQSGLRAMDEAMQRLQLRSGDRIGHGLALGIDPIAWSQQTTYAPLPREDRWLDLVWEFEVHSRDGAGCSSPRAAAVEREIIRLTRAIFGSCGDALRTPQDSVELVNMLFDADQLQDIGFPDGPLPARPRDAMQATLIHYLTNPHVFRQAREVHWVQTKDEGPALEALQQVVRRNYAEAGVVIETNPVSNLLVGDLADLSSHPLWRLSPPEGGTVVGPPLVVSIGSDDPLPFVTNLPEEYQFLYDALILTGRTHAQARTWLDRARLAGLESRFTSSLNQMPTGLGLFSETAFD